MKSRSHKHIGMMLVSPASPDLSGSRRSKLKILMLQNPDESGLKLTLEEVIDSRKSAVDKTGPSESPLVKALVNESTFAKATADKRVSRGKLKTRHRTSNKN